MTDNSDEVSVGINGLEDAATSQNGAYPNSKSSADPSRLLSQTLNSCCTLVEKSSCITEIKVQKFEFTWTIKNFSFCGEQVGEKLESSDFATGPDGELEWCLRAHPKGDAAENEDYLSLFLILVTCNNKTEVLTKFHLFILNGENEKCHTRGDDEASRFTKKSSWGYPQFIKRDFLLNNVNGFLPNDNLTILCEGTVAVDRNNIPRNVAGFLGEAPKCTLAVDLGSLFENQKFSDVTLSVGGKNLLVHKAILVTRSPVFAAMFEHSMEEREQNRVVIDDIEFDVLEEMLTYIYTGKSPNMEKMAADLLVAADKYDLNGLKVMCETVLCSTLTVVNAAELLILADMHCAKQLKAQAIGLVSTHARDIMLTSAWKSLSLTHPHVIAEAFEALASR